jgi:Reverse transcriptase (RNA-dependent DNA polymerase)
VKKLGTDTSSGATSKSISANQIASRLLRISKIQMNREVVRRVKRKLQKMKKSLKPNPSVSSNFILEELELAILAMKSSKAAGLDDIYPEFIKNCGPGTKTWIITFMNDVLTNSKLPKSFKRAKVISILKLGKDGSDPAHYRQIALLSVVYKLLERLILQRIQPLVEEKTPINQAGYRHHRSCTEQVMALTTHIEAGFQHQLKTGAVLVDLTAAYDTVWKEGLLFILPNLPRR